MMKPSSGERFFALDCVRASAMLLGVYYHSILFGFMTGGGPPPFAEGASNGSMQVADFLHSFRMPLFFLIAGFFCRMMLNKYGTGRYLLRRWFRIGLPLLLGLFTVVPIYLLTQSAGMPGRGPGGPGPGGGMPPWARAAPGGPGMQMPPFPPVDAAGKGRPDDGEAKGMPFNPAGENGPGGGRGFGPPGGPGFGPPGGGRGFGPPGGGPPGGPFGAPTGGLSASWFGSSARYFALHHLWFLWYLLLFATGMPLVAMVFGWLMIPSVARVVDRSSRWSFRFCLAPLVLGLASTPLLMMAPAGFSGWSLGLASAIWVPFPDFLFRLEPDMPFYLIYFLAGWLLHREKDQLPDVASVWLPALLLGGGAHAFSAYLSTTYFRQTELPQYDLIRLGAFTLYAVGSAYIAFGFLGLFQRYLNRPTVVGRYLADTALWVYLIHQPLLLCVLRWLGPLHLPWWVQSVLATLLSMIASLLIFEALVRPTPLMRIFGPASPGGPRRDDLSSANGKLEAIPMTEGTGPRLAGALAE